MHSDARLDFLPYGRQTIDEHDLDAVISALKSQHLTQGPLIVEFEKALASRLGARYAVAVNSGTAALHLACLAAGLGKGDEVITSPITFIASANCALYCGAEVRFADIEPETFNIDAQAALKAITPSVKALIPVHMAGQSADMPVFARLAKEQSKKTGLRTFIIEDACHAFGGNAGSSPIGACEHSDMTVFSFHPVKSMTTGEGGAILTNHRDLYEKLCLYRSHGITKSPEKLIENHGPWYYEQQELGYNYRITDLQCALGLSQLKKIDGFLSRRREIVAQYQEYFAHIPGIRLQVENKLNQSAHHLYILLIDFQKFNTSRAELMTTLASRGIGTQVHYIPVYRQPYYQKRYRLSPERFPRAEQYYAQCLSIPIFPTMTNQDVQYVCGEISKALHLV